MSANNFQPASRFVTTVLDGETPCQPPKLLDRVRRAFRVGHYALRTEECYVR